MQDIFFRKISLVVSGLPGKEQPFFSLIGFRAGWQLLMPTVSRFLNLVSGGNGGEWVGNGCRMVGNGGEWWGMGGEWRGMVKNSG